MSMTLPEGLGSFEGMALGVMFDRSSYPVMAHSIKTTCTFIHALPGYETLHAQMAPVLGKKYRLTISMRHLGKETSVVMDIPEDNGKQVVVILGEGFSRSFDLVGSDPIDPEMNRP